MNNKKELKKNMKRHIEDIRKNIKSINEEIENKIETRNLLQEILDCTLELMGNGTVESKIEANKKAARAMHELINHLEVKK